MVVLFLVGTVCYQVELMTAYLFGYGRNRSIVAVDCFTFHCSPFVHFNLVEVELFSNVV
jgi:hypothetical protein